MRILHLSDMHLGQPMVAQARADAAVVLLLNDLREHFDEGVPFDLILLTGDLAWSGLHEEYEQVDSMLARLRTEIPSISDAKILAVPGNHDLVRPKDDELLILYKHVAQHSSEWLSDCLDRQMGQRSGLILAVKKMFGNYTRWYKRLGDHVPDHRPGFLPGDFVSHVDVGGNRLGIIGLNTSFMDVSDATESSFHITERQVAAIVQGEHRNPANTYILITHHPMAYLADSSKRIVNELLGDLPLAFHLFGHVHQGMLTDTRVGGDPRHRLSIMGKSFYGVERTPQGEIDRSIGYSVIDLDLPAKQVRIAPRARKGLPQGGARLTRDEHPDWCYDPPNSDWIDWQKIDANPVQPLESAPSPSPGLTKPDRVHFAADTAPLASATAERGADSAASRHSDTRRARSSSSQVDAEVAPPVPLLIQTKEMPALEIVSHIATLMSRLCADRGLPPKFNLDPGDQLIYDANRLRLRGILERETILDIQAMVYSAQRLPVRSRFPEHEAEMAEKIASTLKEMTVARA